MSLELRELLQRAANGEDLDELLAEADSMEERIRLEASCNKRIQDAEKELDDASAEAAQDMTGQDGEERCNRAARDLIAARDNKLQRMDPLQYAEMRAEGCFNDSIYGDD